MIGNIITNIIDKQVPDKEVALFLSAGVDSCSVGIAAHRLGKKVHAYTFQMKGETNFDSKHAENIAKKMGWEWTLIEVPSDNLIEDFKTLSLKYNCRKKTHFECTWPFLYVYPQIKEKYIISGILADGHWFYNKSLMIKGVVGKKSKKEDLDKERIKYFNPLMKNGRDSLNAQYNPSGWWQQILLGDEYGKVHCNPYEEKEVFDFYMKYSWREIMEPFDKHHVIEAFQKEFDLIGHRKHQNFQTVAKIPTVFETLLNVPEINFKNRIRIMDICRDWYTRTNGKKTKLKSFLKGK